MSDKNAINRLIVVVNISYTCVFISIGKRTNACISIIIEIQIKDDKYELFVLQIKRYKRKMFSCVSKSRIEKGARMRLVGENSVSRNKFVFLPFQRSTELFFL